MPNYYIPDEYKQALEVIADLINRMFRTQVTSMDVLEASIIDYMDDVVKAYIGIKPMPKQLEYVTDKPESRKMTLDNKIINAGYLLSYGSFQK